MAGHAGDRARTRTIGRHSDNFAKLSIAPPDKSNFAAIARPCGPSLNLVSAARQPPRCPASCVFHIKLAEAFKHNLAAIRRKSRIFGQFRGEAIGRYFDDRVRSIGNAACVIDLEGNDAGSAATGRNPAQFAARPEHDLLAIGHPIHQRIKPVHRPCLLQIKIEASVDHPLLPACYILHPQF